MKTLLSQSDRRCFIKGFALASASLLFHPLRRYLLADAQAVEAGAGLVRVNPRDLGLTADFTSAALRVPGLPGPVQLIALRLPNEEYRTLTSVCTHEGCTVDTPLTDQPGLGRVLTCPCHGSMYRPDGTVAGGPAPLPLTSYPPLTTPLPGC